MLSRKEVPFCTITSLDARPPFEQTNRGVRLRPAAPSLVARFAISLLMTGFNDASSAVAEVRG